MENIKVSIIIPVYNSEKYLAKCVESVLAQTFTEYECILIDDNSRDKTLDLCNFYAQKDKRVKVIHNTSNMGSSLARKAGLDISRGAYIQTVDSDDWIEKDMIEKLYEKAVSGDYDMVWCDTYVDYSPEISEYKKISVGNDSIKNIKHFILGFNRGAGLCYKFVKRSVYEGIVFPKEGVAEDKYITSQILHNAKTMIHINEAFYHVVKNPNSQTRAMSIKMQKHRYIGLKYNFQKIIEFLKMTYGDNLEIFEPELSIRMKYIESKKPKYVYHIAKKILKAVIPSKPAQEKLKAIYKKIREVHK